MANLRLYWPQRHRSRHHHDDHVRLQHQDHRQKGKLRAVIFGVTSQRISHDPAARVGACNAVFYELVTFPWQRTEYLIIYVYCHQALISDFYLY